MPVRQVEADQYLSLFLQATPMIDTRAPVEFAKGSFPGAVNLPLMSDAEREKVGTCYKQRGQDAAIELGHSLVQGEVKTARVQQWIEFAQSHPDGVLYCFRGGLRSQICQQWLSEAGCDYPRVVGGYKAMRRYLIDQLEAICAEHPVILLAGHTGAAKTDLLNTQPMAVDLEGLANHLGSSFGRKVGGQPSQIDFENRLAVEFLRRHHLEGESPKPPILLEDESDLIGRCVLPPPLKQAMANAPLVQLEVDLEDRVEHTHTNYILRKLEAWQSHAGAAAGFEAFAEDLRASLKRIRKRLGGARYAELASILEGALLAHQRGDDHLHRVWIRQLLEDYYDPMYDYQLKKKRDRVVFSGPTSAVREYLSSL